MTTRRPRRSGRKGDGGSDRATVPLASIIAAGAAIAGAVVLVAILISGGDDSGSPPEQPAGEDAAPADEDATADRQAIEALARDSIEVLPAGEWPSLYDSFTAEFRDRCPRDEFEQAGVDAAAELGADLQLLGFVRLEGLSIENGKAAATIVGEQQGRGEYQIQAAFQREGGAWRIAPAPDTAGYQAFGRVEG